MSMNDRIKGGLAKFIEAVTPSIDYVAFYEAKVVGQNGDGSLELMPDDPRIPPVSGVPIKTGIPGVTVLVDVGARVMLGFERGNPHRPFAALWRSEGLLELVITADTKVTVNAPEVIVNGGTTGLAKADHTHSAGSLLTGPSGGSPVTGTTGPPDSVTTDIKVQ